MNHQLCCVGKDGKYKYITALVGAEYLDELNAVLYQYIINLFLVDRLMRATRIFQFCDLVR